MTWRTEETEECWTKRWLSYDREGNTKGCVIIAKNCTPELIEAIKKAFEETEGRKR